MTFNLSSAKFPRALFPCIGCCVHALGVVLCTEIVTLELGVVTFLGNCERLITWRFIYTCQWWILLHMCSLFMSNMSLKKIKELQNLDLGLHSIFLGWPSSRSNCILT